jgi:hypothetical protein
MHRQDDYSDIWELGLYYPSGFNSVKDRHGDIHQHHIRSVCFDSLDAICSIPCLSNDLQVRLFLKNVADSPPKPRAIVDNNDSKRCRCHKDGPREKWLPHRHWEGITDYCGYPWGGDCICKVPDRTTLVSGRSIPSLCILALKVLGWRPRIAAVPSFPSMRHRVSFRILWI